MLTTRQQESSRTLQGCIIHSWFNTSVLVQFRSKWDESKSIASPLWTATRNCRLNRKGTLALTFLGRALITTTSFVDKCSINSMTKPVILYLWRYTYFRWALNLQQGKDICLGWKLVWLNLKNFLRLNNEIPHCSYLDDVHNTKFYHYIYWFFYPTNVCLIWFIQSQIFWIWYSRWIPHQFRHLKRTLSASYVLWICTVSV